MNELPGRKTALEDFVRKKRIEGLKKYRGKVSLEIDIDTLRNRLV